MLRQTLSVILASCFIGLFGGIAPGQQIPDQVNAMIAKAEKSVKIVNLETFKSVVNGKESVLLVDVREPDEYAQGHLPNAVNVPRGVLEFGLWKHLGYPKRLASTKKVYLYCHSGPRAVLGAKTLKDLGLKNVFAVVMNIGEWKTAGNPFTK